MSLNRRRNPTLSLPHRLGSRPASWRGLSLLACLSAALFGTQSATAQKPTPQAQPVTEASEAQSPKPRGEGIKVHGHWVLDVKGADGKIVQHRDFENSLVGGPGLKITSGDQLLAALLSGTASMDSISVVFLKGTPNAGSDLTTLCSDGAYAQAHPEIACYAFIVSGSGVLSPLAFPLAAQSPHFTVNRVYGLTEYVTFAPSVAVVLTGNYVVPAGLTEIDAAQTFAAYCGVDANATTPRLTAPNTGFHTGVDSAAACHTDTYYGISVLTSTPLTAPLINLTAGQTITVTVTLSFS